jgi:hypothetical protein
MGSAVQLALVAARHADAEPARSPMGGGPLGAAEPLAIRRLSEPGALGNYQQRY